MEEKTLEKEIPQTKIFVKPYNQMKEEILTQFNKTYFKLLLEKTSGNIAKASKIADISRVAIYKIMKKYNIESFK
jgi:transcriptional regulator of acetoin/glycerol metabolism